MLRIIKLPYSALDCVKVPSTRDGKKLRQPERRRRDLLQTDCRIGGKHEMLFPLPIFDLAPTI